MAGVPADTLDHHRAILSFADLLGKDLYLFPVSRVLVREIGSFLRSISIALRTQIYRRLVGATVGRIAADQRLQQQVQDAYIQDRQNLIASRFRQILVDAELLLQRLKMEAKWNACNLGTQRCSSEADSSNLPQQGSDVNNHISDATLLPSPETPASRQRRDRL